MLALLLACAVALQPPRADDTPSVDPVVRAAELFTAGRFLEAAAAFEEAYDATQDPALLFGRAQALRRAGNCEAATKVMRTFIESSPPAADMEAAQSVIDECTEVLGEAEPPTPASIEPRPPPPPEAARRVPRAEPAPTRDRRAWRKDAAGGVLLAGGVLFAVAGASTYGASFAVARPREETETAHEARIVRGRRTAIAGLAGLGLGGAFVAASVARYIWVARNDASATAAASSPWLMRF